MQTSVGTSPPVLPIHRQPSPLSFSVSSHSRVYSPPPSPDGRSNRRSVAASSLSSVALPLPPDVEIISSEASTSSRARRYVAKSGEDLVPVQPLQDSILFRSTVAQLESSCGTLKKLSKAVHHASSALELALEAVEKAEDDLLYAIGEMTRWLEIGYGIPATDLWGEQGVRKVRKRKWRVQRDEVAAMVSQASANVKSELKRHGLAGAGAQAKFEKATKHYYDQTGAYLSTSDTPSSKSSAPSRSNAVDSEQAARTAQFDLIRYSHHSTLLYAVPPSSISCLDLLVNLYGWMGGILSEHGAYGYTDSQPSHLVEGEHDGKRSLTALDMREDISVALARLAGMRTDLLDRWDMRNDQTNRLEAAVGAGVSAGRPSVDGPSSARESAQSPSSLLQTTPVSSSGIEHRDAQHRKHRIHRIQKSVGGRLRDLLGSGSSSRDLASLEKGDRRAGDRSNRNSFDVSVLARPGAITVERLAGGQPIMEDDQVGAGRAAIDGTKSSPLPALESHSMPSRPVFPSRRSMNLSPTDIPFIVDASLFPLASPSEAHEISQALRSSVSSHASSVAPVGYAPATRNAEAGLGLGLPSVAGGMPVSAFTSDQQEGQEVEELGEVCRKKEGVLWGGGTWEDVGRHGKTRWEKYWVVLDHSSIYEYRDTDFDRPETAHATIDLKFASVREGRGTDRRFVFEIVTPTQGRRLYQATSDIEMKQWIHSISNAIESSINGTSSIRTFDTSKIRTMSGSYDDHALPIRQRLGFPVPGLRSSGSTSAFGHSGTSMQLPTIPASPQGRRSMPPPLRIDDTSQSLHASPPLFAEPKRKRTTSFKKALRQSAEIASQWKDGLVPRSPSFTSDPSRPPFLGVGKRQNSASSGVSSSGVSHASYTAAVGYGYDRGLGASRERERSGERDRDREEEALKRITEDASTVIATPTTGTETGNHTPTLADKSFGSWVDVDDRKGPRGNGGERGGHDGEIEKRVMEMAGLGLGASPSSSHRLPSSRRVKSDSRTQQDSGGMMESATSQAYLSPPMGARAGLIGGEGMTRSRSAEIAPTSSTPLATDKRGQSSRGPNGEVLDMETLRRVAGMKENAVCADCGKSTRQSRWASICLREHPMVVFICIKCCGIHRSFGTHISKPRSVDLDIWTPETIALALEWGNVKGNAMWECRSGDVVKPVSEENMAEFLKAKYVEGRYLSEQDRIRFGLSPLTTTRFVEG